MRSNRRRLSAAKATEATGREPTAHLWGNHLLMVLADGNSGSEALQEELRQELAKVCAGSTCCVRPTLAAYDAAARRLHHAEVLRGVAFVKGTSALSDANTCSCFGLLLTLRLSERAALEREPVPAWSCTCRLPSDMSLPALTRGTASTAALAVAGVPPGGGDVALRAGRCRCGGGVRRRVAAGDRVPAAQLCGAREAPR